MVAGRPITISVPAHHPDAALIAAWAAGSPDAWRAVVDRYRAKLVHYATRLIRDAGEAEEIADDVLLKAQSRLTAFHGRSSLITWLYTCTRNRSINRIAYWSRRQCIRAESIDYITIEGAAIVETIMSSDKDPREAIEQAEFVSRVDLGLQRISLRDRELIQLRVAGRSYNEIGELTGRCLGSVKSGVARAREFLAAALPPAA